MEKKNSLIINLLLHSQNFILKNLVKEKTYLIIVYFEIKDNRKIIFYSYYFKSKLELKLFYFIKNKLKIVD